MLTIHKAGNGTCVLSSKESEGVWVTFEAMALKDAFVSWKSLKQLVTMLQKQVT